MRNPAPSMIKHVISIFVALASCSPIAAQPWGYPTAGQSNQGSYNCRDLNGVPGHLNRKGLCISDGGGAYQPPFVAAQIQAQSDDARTRKLNDPAFAISQRLTDYVPPIDAAIASSGRIIGDTSAVDTLGITEREWTELSDRELLKRLADPATLQKAINLYRRQSPKGLLAIAFLYYSVAFQGGAERYDNYQYDQFGWSLDHTDPGALAEGCDQRRMMDTVCSGKGSRIKNSIEAIFGRHDSDWPFAMGNVLATLPYPRGKWLAATMGLFGARGPSDLYVEAVQSGVTPALGLAFALTDDINLSGCETDHPFRREIVMKLNRAGITNKTLRDTAAARGDLSLQLTRAIKGSGMEHISCYRDNFEESLATLQDLANNRHYLPAFPPLAGMQAAGNGIGISRLKAAKTMLAAYALSRDPEHKALADQYMSEAGGEAQRLAVNGEVDDSPAKPLNNATIAAVIVREMKDAYRIYNPIGFTIDAASNASQWDEANGYYRVSYGSGDTFGMAQAVSYLVTGTKCSKVAARNAFMCSYGVATVLDAYLGPIHLADNVQTPPVKGQFLFEQIGGKWRSPAMQKNILAHSRSTVPATQAADGRNRLCSSLRAGVLAAGGDATSGALHPNSWGC